MNPDTDWPPPLGIGAGSDALLTPVRRSCRQFLQFGPNGSGPLSLPKANKMKANVVMSKLMVGISAAALLIVANVANANPAAVAVAGSVSKSAAAATAVQGQQQGQGQGQQQNGSVSNKSGDSRALGIALGQSPTAAQDCLKGTKFLFGFLEWTDDSGKCENYAAARIAENAASRADTREESDYYMKRANELRARAEGLSIPSPVD